MDTHYYHGSKVGGIKVLEPRLYKQVTDRPVVFATADKNYALAMIHASGAELAVSYGSDANGKRVMFVDELKPDVLRELEQPGHLYAFSAEGFEPSSEDLEGEYVSYVSVPIIEETYIPNVRQALEADGVQVVDYDHVLDSMKSRGKDHGKPKQEHAVDRFQR
ncbi:MAG: hypothetical protein COV10_00610 [Candidatus Vogelbacteria bacterium CG10_big_fil_rev_8_21_14_0_10_51_16]|uniref:Uncharacterized protein n=1 Tax=Candidatus Vogelbacteria bacterium CG10_big_fil_rev_8_21_14_0_10_51_16 TaxID=1975045 RepID=A0A2H0RGM1_9BACT|nr:MAG: hypothetical protein COV10_00610 [Candidatus Vogelbacteria bacterium CG10_big_fil_rev_8_21_14_0_10_51_16]